MGLLDEWDKVKRNENNKKERTKFALTNNAGKPNMSRLSQAFEEANKPKSPTAIPARSSVGSPSKRNILPPGWKERNAAITAQQEEQSLMEGLMQRINSSYEPIMPGGPQGGPNPNDDIMARLTAQLDESLATKLGAIGNVRNQAQEGYNTSDRNLADMFAANANHIATQGSQRFGEIAQNHQNALTANRDESIGKLQADRDQSMNRRAEMLQRLGIQEAGAQMDPGDQTLNNAISQTTNRANTAIQGAIEGGATNQEFNQSVVNSVNQQGTERRAALLQQLQQIQNQLGMAEAEAQQQTIQGKSQLEMQRMQAEAQAQGQSFEDMNKFGYQQFRDDRDLAFDLYKTLTQQQQGGGAEEQAPRVQGYAGLGADLVNQGIPEAQAGQYMAALSQVLGSEYMQGIHPDEGYDRASIIARRLQEMQIPPAIAAHLASNYANLGNNAYYTQQ